MLPSAACAALSPAYGAGSVATKAEEVARESASAVYNPILPSISVCEALI